MKNNKKAVLLIIGIIFLLFIVPRIQQNFIDYIVIRSMDSLDIISGEHITKEHYNAIFYTENFLYVYLINIIISIFDILGIGYLTSILLKEFFKISFGDSILGTTTFYIIITITTISPLSDINNAAIEWVKSMTNFFEALPVVYGNIEIK